MARHHRRLIAALTGFLIMTGCAAPDATWPTQPTPLGLSQTPPTQPTFAEAPAFSQPTVVAPSPTPRLTLVVSPTIVLSESTQSLENGSPSATAPGLQLEDTDRSSSLAVYDSDVDGDDEIYLLPAGEGAPVNLTHHPAEDRQPSWSPDGSYIAFQSDRAGNWEIYTLNLVQHTLQRLTFDPAYDGAPTWSPDGQWIVFESYRDTSPCQFGTPAPNPPPCPDLEIYRISLADGRLERLTDSPGGDYQPVYSPDGQWIAFTSWRDGEKEIYVMPAAGGPARNVTSSPGDDGSPVWTSDSSALVFLSERNSSVELYRQPVNGGLAVRLTGDGLPKERPGVASDGSLLFARYDPGPPFEAYDPYRPGGYHLYRLPPGQTTPQPLAESLHVRRPAIAPGADFEAAQTLSTDGKIQARPVDDSTALELRRMDDVQAPDPRMVAGVDDAFRAWRADVLARSGHDYLARVSDILRPARYYSHRLGYLSWHKTGRAVDLLFDWRDAEGQDALVVVREDIAGETYWRLYLKCVVQDGSLGEPLTQAPWRFWWQPVPAGQSPTPTDGGWRLPIPAGYFVDVTALAERYGWSRIASYHLDDFHWQRDSTATEYWHYQHADGLTWYAAMAQIYPPEVLDELFSRSVAAAREQTAEVMDGKGLPEE